MTPLLGMGAVLVAFALLMVTMTFLRRAGRVGAEMSRKAIHMGMGLLITAFPWIFAEVWPVLVLTGGFLALLIGLRTVPMLKARFGAVLSGVERPSWGDLYFPIAAGGLFVLSHHEPMYYVIPMLILTLADAIAALVGMRRGRHHYLADEGQKSWEGSAAFFVVALVCTAVPLLVAGAAPVHSLLISVCVAAVTMLLEASAWRGLDNLFVPFSTLGMLQLYRHVPEAVLWHHLGGLAMLGVVHGLFRRRVLLREGTLLGALVIVYLCWTLGGLTWAIGPMTVLLTHPILSVRKREGTGFYLRSHPALLAFAAPSMGWLFLDRLLGVPGFAPFQIAFGAQMALAALALWRTDAVVQGWGRVLPAAAFGWLLLVGPWWLFGGWPVSTALFALAAILGAAGLFHVLQPQLEQRMMWHWNVRALLAALASWTGI